MKIATKTKMTLIAATMAFAGAGQALADDGVKVEHLGTKNTLVRVTGDGRYLLLPIQESNEDATINIVVDGKQEDTFRARLAKSKVDYIVPFDLAPYKDRNVVLNILTSQDRSSVREAKNDACWTNFAVVDEYDTTNREKYRPAFHHTPLYGWMNDPNGMFYKDGRWHLYYQWNRYGSKWENMTWGHSSTADLVNWEHHDVAIAPDGLGAIFSGSSAIDSENSAGFGKDAVVAMYTSAGASQIQSLAWSDDNGATFHKFPGNPVITLDSEARDPNMFWNPETKEWTLLLAHALEHEMLIFTSPDMKEWTLKSAFGRGLGAQDGVWECPDLFQLPVQGTGEQKWVLICNINPGGPFGGSGTQYFIGDFDGTTFTSDTDASGNVPTKWLDYGKDNYASVSWSDAPDNRRVLIGWMSNWQYAADVPTMQFRSANTLPRDLSLFRAPDGEIYVASVPSQEVDAMRGRLVSKDRFTAGSKKKVFNLPKENDGICEILADIDASKSSTVTLTLANTRGESVVITYDVAGDKVSFDRTKSGIVDFSQEFPAVTVAPLRKGDGHLSFRMFIDRSSIEIFENEGRMSMTNLVFPNEPYSTLSVSADGGNARVDNFRIYALNPAN